MTQSANHAFKPLHPLNRPPCFSLISHLYPCPLNTSIPLPGPCPLPPAPHPSFDDHAPLTPSARFQFGRCSVRRHFDAAIAILKDKSDLFKSFVEHVVDLDEAVDFYTRFERNEVGKTVFVTQAGKGARGKE